MHTTMPNAMSVADGGLIKKSNRSFSIMGIKLLWYSPPPPPPNSDKSGWTTKPHPLTSSDNFTMIINYLLIYHSYTVLFVVSQSHWALHTPQFLACYPRADHLCIIIIGGVAVCGVTQQWEIFAIHWSDMTVT